MKKLTTVLATALAVGVVGCGGSGGGGGGSATVSGTVSGMHLNVADSVSGTVTGQSGQATGILITNVPGTCSVISANYTPKNLQALVLALAVGGSSGTLTAPTSPGTFMVSTYPSATGNVAFAGYTANDSMCQPSANVQANSGSVKVTSISNSGVSGTFDLTMSTGDHLTGTFDAPNCAAFENPPKSDGGTPPCR